MKALRDSKLPNYIKQLQIFQRTKQATNLGLSRKNTFNVKWVKDDV